MLVYPAKFKKEDGGYIVTFPDVPHAISHGDSIEDATKLAEGTLLAALSFYFDENKADAMEAVGSGALLAVEVQRI